MPTRPAPRDLRASDGDRDRIVAVLNAALGDGRLTAEEHDERVSAALSARTLGDLADLTTDLATPGGQPIQLHSGPTLGGVPLINGLFHRESRSGRWVVPADFIVNVVGTSVTLDFREALLTDRHTIVRAHAVAGSVRMLVPDGVTVTVGGTIILGSRKGVTAQRVPPAVDQPLIEVRAFVFRGKIQVKTPPRPRRWFPGARRRELS